MANAPPSVPVDAVMNADDNDDEGDVAPPYDPSLPPLDRRVLDCVKRSPRRDGGSSCYVIRPARLAAELGIGVDDANAELCGLLAAVGGGQDGASFVFEETTVEGPVDGGDAGKPSSSSSSATQPTAATTTTMVFKFPPDFERRAVRSRRVGDARSAFLLAVDVAIKALKVVVAFGLIISLAILSVAALCLLVALIVAVSRGGGHNRHRSALMQRVRSIFYTLRQLLWCYAIFGSGLDDEGRDPFLREVAGNLALALSLCCGNPMHPFFWMRVMHMNRRSRRMRRGWGSGGRGGASRWGFGGGVESVEGVALVRRGSWGRDGGDPLSSSEGEQQSHRGLLSVAVEFLFGPTPFRPGPSDRERWVLRANAIIARSSESPGRGVSLEEILPYADDPPTSMDDTRVAVAEGLRIVSHFNGVPAEIKSESEGGMGQAAMVKARFVFPELMAEADEGGMALDLPPRFTSEDDSSENLLYAKDDATPVPSSGRTLGGTGTHTSTKTMPTSTDLPRSLLERRYVLTRLSQNQFGQCLFLGILNYLGVVWVRQSIGPGGYLELPPGTTAFTAAAGTLSLLRFYAILFFALPAARLVVVVLLNSMLERRNGRRSKLADGLSSSGS